MSRQKILEAELLNQHLEETEERMDALEKNRGELQQLKDAIDALQGLEGGEETLVPLARGIFVKAKHVQTDRLLVNVGKGIVIPKTPEELRASLDEQERELGEERERLRARFEALLGRIKEIEKGFEGK